MNEYYRTSYTPDTVSMKVSPDLQSVDLKKYIPSEAVAKSVSRSLTRVFTKFGNRVNNRITLPLAAGWGRVEFPLVGDLVYTRDASISHFGTYGIHADTGRGMFQFLLLGTDTPNDFEELTWMSFGHLDTRSFYVFNYSADAKIDRAKVEMPAGDWDVL